MHLKRTIYKRLKNLRPSSLDCCINIVRDRTWLQFSDFLHTKLHQKQLKPCKILLYLQV